MQIKKASGPDIDLLEVVPSLKTTELNPAEKASPSFTRRARRFTMIRITSIYVMSAALVGALAWSTTGAGAGTLNLHTSTPSVKVTPPKVQLNPQPLPPRVTPTMSKAPRVPLGPTNMPPGPSQ